MSIPVVIPWLPVTGNESSIAPVQSLAAAGALALHSSVPGYPQSPYIYDRVIRSVSLNSANDNHAITFTIKGIGSPVNEGNPTQVLKEISEDVIGPVDAGHPTSSVNIYSRILSITANGAVNALSVGFGTFGITDYVFLDYNRSYAQTSIQVAIKNKVAISAEVYQSLDKPEVSSPDGNLIVMGAPTPFHLPAPLDVALTDNALGYLPSPACVVWASISVTAADSLTFTVLQQGIR